MTKCNIQFHAVPVYSGPGGQPIAGEHFSGNLASKAVGRCMTHNFDMPDAPMSHDTLCPIGQIEEATEKALEKIRTVML